MKPAPFEYYAPGALDEALELLERLGEGAKLLAGGQSLVPLLNMRLARPDALIDLNRVAGLDEVRREGGELRLGAMLRHRRLERDALVREHVPLLAEAASHIAHMQIRTRGTLGGSLANAAPAAELPAAVLALEARLVVRSRSGTRELRPEGFFSGALQTALAPDEILVEVRVPIPAPGTGWAFAEFARRRGDFALAGAAALVRRDAARRIAAVRLALCGVAEVPLRLARLERTLVGEAPGERLLARVEAAVRAEVTPRADLHLSAESRLEVAAEVARRAVSLALERCR
ncbi:MAG TPA: FAD binding domain-containing protein [Burkholderiales bacterium]|nr:FAD binding domain-containing protein [Burkholderiales bacterium]